ncbi:Outer membrane lipoprotein [Vibrio chagasii]|nr:Outer membrane lipoprotein [Vibrio chagasii]
MNIIKHIKTILVTASILVLSGCASEPITVLRTEYGKIVREQVVTATENSTLATLGGAAAGGILGNQVGGGSGKTVATVVGTVAGGAAGKNLSTKSVNHYEYEVHMNSGEKFLLETKKKRQKIGATVVVENLSNGRERINVI